MYYWAHHPYNNISKFSYLAFREEMRISILSQLLRVYHTSPLSTQVLFLTSQCTLLMLRHPRRTFIKFLRLHVPHVLWHDVDPMAKDFCWNSGRNFPICHPLFDISIAQTLHSFHFSTRTLNLCTYSIYSCPYKYQEPVRGEFSSSRKSKNLSIYFSIYFSFLHVLFSSTLLPSLHLLSTFNPLLGMSRFTYLVDSAESIESFKAQYRIPPRVSIRYCKEGD